jgi:hypothetical protein
MKLNPLQIHTYFLKKGKPGFNLPVSKILLFLILLVSIAQLGLALVGDLI